MAWMPYPCIHRCAHTQPTAPPSLPVPHHGPAPKAVVLEQHFPPWHVAALGGQSTCEGHPGPGCSRSQKALGWDKEAGNLFHGVANGQGLWMGGGHKLTASPSTISETDLSIVRMVLAMPSGPYSWVQSPKYPTCVEYGISPAAAQYSHPPEHPPILFPSPSNPINTQYPGGEIKADGPPSSPNHSVEVLIKAHPHSQHVRAPCRDTAPCASPPATATAERASPRRQRKHMCAWRGNGRRCQGSGAIPPPPPHRHAASRGAGVGCDVEHKLG